MAAKSALFRSKTVYILFHQIILDSLLEFFGLYQYIAEVDENNNGYNKEECHVFQVLS